MPDCPYPMIIGHESLRYLGGVWNLDEGLLVLKPTSSDGVRRELQICIDRMADAELHEQSVSLLAVETFLVPGKSRARIPVKVASEDVARARGLWGQLRTVGMV